MRIKRTICNDQNLKIQNYSQIKATIPTINARIPFKANGNFTFNIQNGRDNKRKKKKRINLNNNKLNTEAISLLKCTKKSLNNKRNNKKWMNM